MLGKLREDRGDTCTATLRDGFERETSAGLVKIVSPLWRACAEKIIGPPALENQE